MVESMQPDNAPTRRQNIWGEEDPDGLPASEMRSWVSTADGDKLGDNQMVDDTAATVAQFEDERNARWYRAALTVASRTGRLELGVLQSLESRLGAALPPRHERDMLAQQVTAEQHAYAGRCSAVATHSEVLIDRVRRGALRAALLLDVGHDGLTVMVIAVDRRAPGGVSMHEVPTRPWANLLPGLPSDAAGQVLAIAAGPDVPDGWTRSLTSSITAITQALGGFQAKSWEAVLVQRAPGWAIVEQVAAVAKTIVPELWRDELPQSEPISLSTFVLRLLEDVPLTLNHSLLAASLSADNSRVTVETHPMFEAGSSRRSKDAHAVTIAAPPGCREPVTLAVIAEQGAVEDASLLTAYSVVLEPGESCRLLARLNGPGQVSLASKHTLTRVELTLSEFLARVPARIDPQLTATLDLVCVLDCIGEPDVVGARAAFLGDIVDHLQAGYPLAGGLRLGVVGYADELHLASVARNQALPPRIEVISLGETETVLRRADGLATLTHPSQDYPGLLEEALDALLQPSMGWRNGSSRAVVFIGDRPPHPSAVGRHRLVRAPSGIDWEARVEVLRQQHGARMVAVRWPTEATWRGALADAVQQYAEQCWSTLGADGLFSASAGSHRTVAAALDPSFGRTIHSLTLPLVIGELLPGSMPRQLPRSPRSGGFW